MVEEEVALVPADGDRRRLVAERKVEVHGAENEESWIVRWIEGEVTE